MRLTRYATFRLPKESLASSIFVNYLSYLHTHNITTLKVTCLRQNCMRKQTLNAHVCELMRLIRLATQGLPVTTASFLYANVLNFFHIVEAHHIKTLIIPMFDQIVWLIDQNLPVSDWKQWRSNVSASRSSIPKQPATGDNCWEIACIECHKLATRKLSFVSIRPEDP